jgi:hypothetical protein
MAAATSISLKQFTATVQQAVQKAVANHPKFKNLRAPSAVSVSYLIRGIPVPEDILKTVTVSETEAFANDIASGIAGAHPNVVSASGSGGKQGAIISVGGHLIVGIPAVAHPVEIKE